MVLTNKQALALYPLILADLETRGHHAKRQAGRLRECFAAMEAEASHLAAGVCEHRLGNEHGNAYCGKTGELI